MRVWGSVKWMQNRAEPIPARSGEGVTSILGPEFTRLIPMMRQVVRRQMRFPMESTLWVLQWVVSLVGVGAYCMLLYYCFKEFGAWGIAFLLFPPALLLFYVPTRWPRCKYPLLTFLACVVLAMLFQRARLGYWAWPDVESGA